MKSPRHFDSHVLPFAGWEMYFMRAGLALVYYYCVPQFIYTLDQPIPNGLAHWIDFRFLADEHTLSILRWMLLGSLVPYVAGICMTPALGYIFFLLLSLGTFENSQGTINHYMQLVVLTVLGQFIFSAWADFRALFLHREKWSPRSSLWSLRHQIHAARLVVAGGYVVSAVSKLIISQGQWIWRSPNVALEVIKTHANAYYNTLVPTSAFFSETVPNLILNHPYFARLFFASSLCIELFFFLGLLSRRWSAAIGILAILMHIGIGKIMELHFEEHEAILLLIYINVPFWIVVGYSRWRQTKSQATGA